MTRLFRLHGPLSADPNAGTLYALALALSIWFAVWSVILLPLYPNALGRLPFALLRELGPVATVILLRLGFFRQAIFVYLIASWFSTTVVMAANGGIRSTTQVWYVTLPILAAWLLGYSGAMWMAALCLGTTLCFALLEVAGVRPAHVFPGTPLTLWSNLVQVTLVGAVPVAQVLKMLRTALAELRESELRFRNMANAAPVLIRVAGTDNSCTFFNRRWLEFTGRTLKEEYGRGWFASVHRDDVVRCEPDTRGDFELEYRLRRADGEYRWMLESGVPRYSSRGVWEGYIACAIDITDLKENHEKLIAAQKLESLGIMAAGVAHDFGNLLGSVYGEIDLALQEMPPDAPGRENLHRIGELAEYAAEIIDLLRASARAGISPNDIGPVDLGVLIDQTLRLPVVTNSKQTAVHCTVPNDLPHVHGNHAQIRQVVMNLITNAVEALEGKPGTITVVAGKSPLPAHADGEGPSVDYVRLTVADTGCGMTPEIRSRIFDQFFTTKSLGRGLGLAAVHGIIRTLGGAIDVQSAPGAGTLFDVWFPAAETEAHSADQVGHARA